MKFSIITINYNGSESTIKLLQSFEKQTDKDFQTIIVDNASEESDFKTLSDYVNVATSQVATLRNEDNLGFSGGNNAGIKKALWDKADWIILLNNDTWVEKDFVSRLKEKLNKLNGIVGLPLNEGNKTAYCGKIQWLKPTLKHIYVPTSQVGTYAIGGGMAIHREVFDRTGFLDEKYFLYFEDADFCIQARENNIPTSIMHDIIIYHNTSSTTKKLGTPLLLRYHYRNALYFNWKNGPWYIKLAIWPWSFWIIKKQLWKIMFMYKQNESLAILYGVFDFYRGKMGQIKV